MSARTTSEPGAMTAVRAWAGVGLLGFALVLVVGAVRAEPQTTTRVSIATGGAQALGGSQDTAISADGRYVAFASDAANLVAGDTNGSADVFVHDGQTGTTARVSVTSAGGQVDGHSRAPSLSADGRFVAFESRAAGLVPGDTNGETDVFVRDMEDGTTERVSVATGGAEAVGRSRAPSISADGRFVAFSSTAFNLVPNDLNGSEDVFVHDRVTGTTSRVSVGPVGVQALGGGSHSPDISGDGRYVGFLSSASNLVATDTNGSSDVFVHDRTNGSTMRVSLSSSEAQANGPSMFAALSHDARFVVFSSDATNLVPNDTNDDADVFLRDRETGATTRVSVGPAGQQSAGGPVLGANSGFPDISADGRFITYYSYANNLVPDDVTDSADVFLHDVATGLTTRLSGGLPMLPTAYCLSFEPKVSADGGYVVFSSNCTNLVTGDTNDASDIFVSAQDEDGDKLPTYWEVTFGLSPSQVDGDNGADGDADGDGRTNAQEFADGTHPRGFYTRYLAEGAASGFFDTRLALLNPAGLTTVLLRFQKGDGTSAGRVATLDGITRATVDAKSVAGLATAEFSTIIESDGPVVVDRQMTWDATGYGSHAETALAAPSTTWYLAEGATHSNFSLFYLVQNPHATVVPVTVTYLLPAPAAPLTKVYTVPAESRFNIWVNNESSTDPMLAALRSTDVSAVITAPQPILVERAMYLTQAGPDGQFGTPDDILFGAGHESAGVPAPALSWFLAEGATGPYFDEFILIANPGPSAAEVEARYLLTDGTVLTKTYAVPARSRFNIWVNEENFPGLGKALAEEALSAMLTSTNGVPIIVERAMWWPRPAATWMEAHNTPGATATGTRWGLAEGEVGGAALAETYILVANTSAFAGTARVTLVLEGGGIQTVDVPLAASSRMNVPVIESWFPGVTGKRFGVLVESLGDTPAQIVVERAMYSDANGIHWAAGSNAAATRLVP